MELSFDFDAGRDKIICPKCGGEVREGPKGISVPTTKTDVS